MWSQSRLFSVPASFLAEICFSIATKERKCSKSGYLQKSIFCLHESVRLSKRAWQAHKKFGARDKRRAREGHSRGKR